jgi:hypothetical protein
MVIAQVRIGAPAIPGFLSVSGWFGDFGRGRRR